MIRGKTWFGIGGAALAGVLLMGLLSTGWDSLVESQIFFPDKGLEALPGDYSLAFEDQWINTSDGQRIHAWWIPAPDAKTVMLFCHGNAGNISHRLDNLARLHKLGLSVLIFDYRGYGRSSGSISEKGMYLDVEAAYEAAARRAQDSGARLVVFGRSLGGVAACRVGGRPDMAGLILESTFPNLGAMAKLHFPLPGLEGKLSRRFCAESDIKNVTAPILFFHGDRDGIVPHELGRRLYRAASDPKEFVTLKGAGHNDTYLAAGQPYWQKIKDFIASLPPKG